MQLAALYFRKMISFRLFFSALFPFFSPPSLLPPNWLNGPIPAADQRAGIQACPLIRRAGLENKKKKVEKGERNKEEEKERQIFLQVDKDREK